MKTLALLGASGRTGQQVIDEALSRGYQLRILARTPEKLKQEVRDNPLVTVIQGDARHEPSLADLLQGADAVVSTLGPAGINQSFKQAKHLAKEHLCFNSTQTLLPLMKAQGIRRIVVTGGASLELPEDKNGFFIRFLLTSLAPKMLGEMATDRQKEYELLKQTDVDWTIARCGRFIDSPSQKPLKTSSRTFQGMDLNVPDMARFLLDQVTDTSMFGKAVYLSN